MSSSNSLGALRSVLTPTGQQRLFEFLEGVDTHTAARFRNWLSTANDTQIGAVANLLDHAGHGREFAGWWRTHDKVQPRPPAETSTDDPPQVPGAEKFRPRAQSRAASRDVKFGALWLSGGLAVTLATLTLAANNPRGGSYVIAIGAIVYGGLRLLRGLKAGG